MQENQEGHFVPNYNTGKFKQNLFSSHKDTQQILKYCQNSKKIEKLGGSKK